MGYWECHQSFVYAKQTLLTLYQLATSQASIFSFIDRDCDSVQNKWHWKGSLIIASRREVGSVVFVGRNQYPTIFRRFLGGRIWTTEILEKKVWEWIGIYQLSKHRDHQSTPHSGNKCRLTSMSMFTDDNLHWGHRGRLALWTKDDLCSFLLT